MRVVWLGWRVARLWGEAAVHGGYMGDGMAGCCRPRGLGQEEREALSYIVVREEVRRGMGRCAQLGHGYELWVAWLLPMGRRLRAQAPAMRREGCCRRGVLQAGCVGCACAGRKSRGDRDIGYKVHCRHHGGVMGKDNDKVLEKRRLPKR